MKKISLFSSDFEQFYTMGCNGAGLLFSMGVFFIGFSLFKITYDLTCELQ